MRGRHLTRRALGVGCGGLLLFGAASTAQAGWLFVLAAGVLGLLGASLVAPHRLLGCAVARELPARAAVGERVKLRLAVRNQGRRAVPALRLVDAFPAFAPARVTCDRVGPGETASVELDAVAQRRGAWACGDVSLVAGWPFGLVTSRRMLTVPSALLVVPRWTELRSLPPLAPSTFATEAPRELARAGAGNDYFGVREYRPGDPPRAVHWRASARTGHLVVREPQDEAHGRVAILLAAGDEGTPPQSSFETLVSAAASLALHALVTGHRVALLRPREEGGLEILRDADRTGALEWLARARPVDVDASSLIAATAQRAGRGGTVVILTSTASKGAPGLPAAVRSVRAHGARPLVVTARSETWDGSAASGRAAFADLRDVESRSISKGEDLRACLEG